MEDGPPQPVEHGAQLLMECELPLGRAGLIVHNELTLSGWAVSPVGVAGLAVQIEDRQWNASYGHDTPWLARRFADTPNAARAGYRLRIDTSQWAPGPHYVTVAAFDKDGGRRAIEGQVDIRPFGGGDSERVETPPEGRATLRLDEPLSGEGICEVSGPLCVTGWARSESGIETVVVTLDGRIQHDALRPIVRPELLDSHGPEEAANAGFALRLHPSECPPGDHTLTVVALGRDGETAGLERRLRCHPEPKPTAAEAALQVASLAEGDAPRPHAPARDMWQDRALLAETDAAMSRASADLARRQQETTLRLLREIDERLAQDVHAPGAPPRDERTPSDRRTEDPLAGLQLERWARYRWAARLAAAGRVLDAGCGIGSGTARIAVHAHEAVGVDISPAAIEEARREHGDTAAFREGDLRQLPFEAGEFDLVVCFEALTHVAETELVLDELRRVLRPGGTLLVSAPNPAAYPRGNPLQLAELTPAELERRLAARFANVATHRQQTYFASLLGTAATLEHDDPGVRIDADVVKLAGCPSGGELYSVAVATDAGLPPEPAWIALGEQADYERQRRLLAEWQDRAVEAEAEVVALRNRLQG